MQGRLLRCALEHLRHLSERESLSIDRDRGDKKKARTFTDIQDFRFSKGAHVDLRCQQDPLDGTEPRHLSGKIFVRTPTEMPGSSSSEMRTETKPVVEPTVIPSATNLPRTTRVNRHLFREPMRRKTESLLTWKPMIPTRRQLFLSHLCSVQNLW